MPTLLEYFMLPWSAARLACSVASGKEPYSSVMQRLGLNTVPRKEGPVIWFHVTNVGECSVGLPLLLRCLLEYNQKVGVLLTTGSPDLYFLLKETLPTRVTVQLAPMDTPVCIALFMERWKPQVAVILSSPLSPHLITVAAQYGVHIALLNACLSGEEVLRWHSYTTYRKLLSTLLSKFDLIVPVNDTNFGYFCLFGAEMRQMPGWCGDLKHAAALGAGGWHLSRPCPQASKDLAQALASRPTWLAAHTQPGEERLLARVHARVAAQVEGLRTVLVPGDGSRCTQLQQELQREHGLSVDVWQGPCAAYPGDVLLVDDASQLSLLYAVCETVLVANSMLEGCAGESLAGPAVACCAVLVGPHAGQSSTMAEELNLAAVAAAEEASAAVRSAGTIVDDSPPSGLHGPTGRDQQQRQWDLRHGSAGNPRSSWSSHLQEGACRASSSAPTSPALPLPRAPGQGSPPSPPWNQMLRGQAGSAASTSRLRPASAGFPAAPAARQQQQGGEEVTPAPSGTSGLQVPVGSLPLGPEDPSGQGVDDGAGGMPAGQPRGGGAVWSLLLGRRSSTRGEQPRREEAPAPLAVCDFRSPCRRDDSGGSAAVDSPQQQRYDPQEGQQLRDSAAGCQQQSELARHQPSAGPHAECLQQQQQQQHGPSRWSDSPSGSRDDTSYMCPEVEQDCCQEAPGPVSREILPDGGATRDTAPFVISELDAPGTRLASSPEQQQRLQRFGEQAAPALPRPPTQQQLGTAIQAQAAYADPAPHCSPSLPSCPSASGLEPAPHRSPSSSSCASTVLRLDTRDVSEGAPEELAPEHSTCPLARRDPGNDAAQEPGPGSVADGLTQSSALPPGEPAPATEATEGADQLAQRGSSQGGQQGRDTAPAAAEQSSSPSDWSPSCTDDTIGTDDTVGSARFHRQSFASWLDSPPGCSRRLGQAKRRSSSGLDDKAGGGAGSFPARSSSFMLMLAEVMEGCDGSDSAGELPGCGGSGGGAAELEDGGGGDDAGQRQGASAEAGPVDAPPRADGSPPSEVEGFGSYAAEHASRLSQMDRLNEASLGHLVEQLPLPWQSLHGRPPRPGGHGHGGGARDAEPGPRSARPWMPLNSAGDLLSEVELSEDQGSSEAEGSQAAATHGTGSTLAGGSSRRSTLREVPGGPGGVESRSLSSSCGSEQSRGGAAFAGSFWDLPKLELDGSGSAAAAAAAAAASAAGEGRWELPNFPLPLRGFQPAAGAHRRVVAQDAASALPPRRPSSLLSPPRHPGLALPPTLPPVHSPPPPAAITTTSRYSTSAISPFLGPAAQGRLPKLRTSRSASHPPMRWCASVPGTTRAQPEEEEGEMPPPPLPAGPPTTPRFASTVRTAEADPADGVPDTPCSRTSTASPFAGAVHDRPCPFSPVSAGNYQPPPASLTSDTAFPAHQQLAATWFPSVPGTEAQFEGAEEGGDDSDEVWTTRQLEAFGSVVPQHISPSRLRRSVPCIPSPGGARQPLLTKQVSDHGRGWGNAASGLVSPTHRPAAAPDAAGRSTPQHAHTRTLQHQSSTPRRRARPVSESQACLRRSPGSEDEESVVPETPTSCMTNSSPFAGAELDRPCPFSLTPRGSQVSMCERLGGRMGWDLGSGAEEALGSGSSPGVLSAASSAERGGASSSSAVHHRRPLRTARGTGAAPRGNQRPGASPRAAAAGGGHHPARAVAAAAVGAGPAYGAEAGRPGRQLRSSHSHLPQLAHSPPVQAPPSCRGTADLDRTPADGRDGAEEEPIHEPGTPMSCMSNASPFADSVYDRPRPFAVSPRGQQVPLAPGGAPFAPAGSPAQPGASLVQWATLQAAGKSVVGPNVYVVPPSPREVVEVGPGAGGAQSAGVRALALLAAGSTSCAVAPVHAGLPPVLPCKQRSPSVPPLRTSAEPAASPRGRPATSPRAAAGANAAPASAAASPRHNASQHGRSVSQDRGGTSRFAPGNAGAAFSPRALRSSPGALPCPAGRSSSNNGSPRPASAPQANSGALAAQVRRPCSAGNIVADSVGRPAAINHLPAAGSVEVQGCRALHGNEPSCMAPGPRATGVSAWGLQEPIAAAAGQVASSARALAHTSQEAPASPWKHLLAKDVQAPWSPRKPPGAVSRAVSQAGSGGASPRRGAAGFDDDGDRPAPGGSDPCLPTRSVLSPARHRASRHSSPETCAYAAPRPGAMAAAAAAAAAGPQGRRSITAAEFAAMVAAASAALSTSPSRSCSPPRPTSPYRTLFKDQQQQQQQQRLVSPDLQPQGSPAAAAASHQLPCRQLFNSPAPQARSTSAPLAEDPSSTLPPPTAAALLGLPALRLNSAATAPTSPCGLTGLEHLTVRTIKIPCSARRPLPDCSPEPFPSPRHGAAAAQFAAPGGHPSPPYPHQPVPGSAPLEAGGSSGNAGGGCAAELSPRSLFHELQQVKEQLQGVGQLLGTGQTSLEQQRHAPQGSAQGLPAPAPAAWPLPAPAASAPASCTAGPGPAASAPLAALGAEMQGTVPLPGLRVAGVVGGAAAAGTGDPGIGSRLEGEVLGLRVQMQEMMGMMQQQSAAMQQLMLQQQQTQQLLLLQQAQQPCRPAPQPEGQQAPRLQGAAGSSSRLGLEAVQAHENAGAASTGAPAPAGVARGTARAATAAGGAQHARHGSCDTSLDQHASGPSMAAAAAARAPSYACSITSDAADELDPSPRQLQLLTAFGAPSGGEPAAGLGSGSCPAAAGAPGLQALGTAAATDGRQEGEGQASSHGERQGATQQHMQPALYGSTPQVSQAQPSGLAARRVVPTPQQQSQNPLQQQEHGMLSSSAAPVGQAAGVSRSKAAAAAAAEAPRADLVTCPSPERQRQARPLAQGADGAGVSGSPPLASTHYPELSSDYGDPSVPPCFRWQRGYILPASQLPRGSSGPAVWRVDGEVELADALCALLRDPTERRSRGQAAAQAAAKLASGLVGTVWNVLDELVVTPSLQDYVSKQRGAGADGGSSGGEPELPGPGGGSR